MEATQESIAPAGAPVGESGNRTFLLVALLLGIAALWVLPISSSLWLDETGTYWVVKDDLGAAIDRATRFQGQTPLYYVLAWTAKRIGGANEVALRMPSLLAMGIAVLLLYRLGRRLFDDESAMLATVVFATNPIVVFAAADARPYAITTAVLLGATLALVRWLDEGRVWDGIAYVLLASATIYLHYLFAPALAAHAVYAWRRRGRVHWRTITSVGAGLGVLLLPALSQLLSLAGRRGSLSVPSSDLIQGLFGTIAPPILFTAMVTGLLIARIAGPVSLDHRVPRRGSFVLTAALLLIVPISFFVISEYTATKIFAQRYMVGTVIGLALLGGWVIACTVPARARRIVVIAILFWTAFSVGGDVHYVENWQEGIAMANKLIDRSDTPVLVHTAFIEAAQVDWLTHPERASYLMAPIAFYPIEGHPIPMPYQLNAPAAAYLEHVTRTELIRHDQFLLITRYGFVPFKAWLDGRLAGTGFRSTSVIFGNVIVHEYRRAPLQGSDPREIVG